jgi:uncharacterized protein DUF6768
MSFLDVRINELLSETDAHLLRSSQPHGWLGIGKQMFKSRLGWLVWVMLIVEAAALIGAIWTAVTFFQATDTLVAVKYGLIASSLVMIAVFLQIGLHAQMQVERVIRALKRVEILVLSKKQ